MSGLVDNTIRGVLAEFIVARAVGAATVGTRDPWATFDLETPEGVKIEVKSSSYLQSWAQDRLSDINFGIAPSYAWDPEIGDFKGKPKRHADVYVFALLAHKDQPTIDPMNLDQWRFYVLPTTVLDKEFNGQKSLPLSRLETLAEPVRFDGIKATVLQARAREEI